MATPSNQPPAKIPALAMLITTYELSQENGKPVFVATVSHTFLGDTEEDLKRIMYAHAKTDQFFAGSLKGLHHSEKSIRSKLLFSGSGNFSPWKNSS